MSKIIDLIASPGIVERLFDFAFQVGDELLPIHWTGFGVT
jgi:hypothetical protein